MTIRMFEVGGCVRDHLLGLTPKDIDYAIEAAGYHTMKAFLEARGFTIFLETPGHGTIRARFPKVGDKSSPRPLTADFVLCRKDGPSSDGRRPDYVEWGTIEDDLARRDFTVNAMAREVIPRFSQGGQLDPGTLIDLHGGVNDLADRILRFVGDPMQRLREDGLRALRAIRFKITKEFTFAPSTIEALLNPETATLLGGCSVERKREELDRCFAHDSRATCDLLFHELRPDLVDAIFTDGLRLMPTLKGR